jgi:hypothetical protein
LRDVLGGLGGGTSRSGDAACLACLSHRRIKPLAQGVSPLALTGNRGIRAVRATPCLVCPVSGVGEAAVAAGLMVRR